jgi:hypothetical protein
VNETKLAALLKTDDVLCAHRIRAPERFVKVFAVPAAELGGAVIDVIEWATALEHALDLPKLADVATRVERHFDVSPQAEADLVGLMRQIARDDVMTAATQLGDQAGADGSETAGYKYVHKLRIKL